MKTLKFIIAALVIGILAFAGTAGAMTIIKARTIKSLPPKPMLVAILPAVKPVPEPAAQSHDDHDHDHDEEADDGSEAAAQLSDEEYDSIKASLVKIVEDQGPMEAMVQLEKLMNENPGILRSCHGLVHNIGHATMDKFNDFSEAMKYQNDLCGSGYLHGIIEEKFEKSKDVFTDMMTICEPKNERSCYHGVGHGLMYYTNNDLPKSIELCEKYTENEAKVGCAEGIFMENFNSNTQFHPTKYLNPENPFYPCGDQKDIYKAVCYFYAPSYYLSLHKDAYKEALEWCKSAERGYEAACAKGAGSRIVKENLGDVEMAEKVCMTQPDLTTQCIDGMVSYYIVNFASLQKGQEMCDKISDANKPTCLAGVESRKGWYESD